MLDFIPHPGIPRLPGGGVDSAVLPAAPIHHIPRHVAPVVVAIALCIPRLPTMENLSVNVVELKVQVEREDSVRVQPRDTIPPVGCGDFT